MAEIKKKDLDFLSSELNYWLEEEIITDEQAKSILNLYDIKERPLRLILSIAGAILIGLGGISFVAAHWAEIPKLIRVFTIVTAYLMTLAISYSLSAYGFKKTGRAFLLLGSFLIGAGIFLITRMYNYKLTEASGTGWWIIGLIIVTLISRDEWQLYLLEAVSFFYLIFSDSVDIFALEFITLARVPIYLFFEPYMGFLLIMALYLICMYIKDRTGNNFAMLLALMLIASRMTLCLGGTLSLIILVTLGIILSFIKKWNDASSFGLLMAGMLGLLLTWPEFWRGEFFSNASLRSFLPVLTAVILATVMLFQIYKGRVLSGGLFFTLLLARYFFDRIFGYMPKAWGFTIIGVIFLIAGFYFELKNKKHNSDPEE